MNASLNLNSVMLGSIQPKVLGEFYEKVLGKKADWGDDWGYGWQVGAAMLTVGEHSEMSGPTKDPGRVMFNLETTDVQGEFARIAKTGATIIKEPYEMEGMWIATFADPDNNYFQLMSPMPSEK